MAECFKLENGLRVISEYMPYSKSIAFGIFVKNGSRNEPEDLSGVSHFIEHMLFKGTGKRSQKNIAEDMDAIGGEINAYTAKEYTCYYMRVLDENIDSAMELLCDMFFNSVFDEREMEREKNIIYEEIGMYEDQPDDVVVDRLHSEIWKNSSLGKPILGTRDSVGNIDRNRLVKYFNENYRTENTVISFAGNIDRERAEYYANKYFGNRKNEKIYQYDTKAVYEPAFLNTEKNIEQVHLCMNFEGLNIHDENRYTMALLNLAAGGGMSSRLFQSIREELGLVYSIYSYTSSYRDTGVFEICAELNPANTETVIKNILYNLEKMKNDIISDEKLDKLKIQLKSNIILGQEGTGGTMSAMGRSIVLKNEYTDPETVLRKIEMVKAGDIKKLADKIFNINSFSISLAGNTKNTDIESIIKIYKSGKI